jgi:transcriptional regulator of acetoin/glycerol metabolism
MSNLANHTSIEARIREFAQELADGVRQATLAALREALRAGSELAARPAVRAPARSMSSASNSSSTPSSAKASAAKPIGAKGGGDAGSPTLSLDHYERMAIQRGLHEAGGDVLGAAKLLGLTKSSIYRRMRALGIPRRTPGQRGALTVESEFLTTREPVSLERYELMALERALEESGGDILAASKLLKIGKSTMYRKLTAHRRASEGGKAPKTKASKPADKNVSKKASGARRKKASKRHK